MSEKPQSRAAVRCDARKRLPHLVGNRCCHRFQVHELVISLTLQVRHRAAKLICALTQFGNQPRIFNRDNGLVGKVLNELDLFVCEGANSKPHQRNDADRMTLPQQWNAEAGAISEFLLRFMKRVLRIGQYVSDLHWFSLQCHTPQNATPARLKDNLASNFAVTSGTTVCREGTKIRAIWEQRRLIRITKSCSQFNHSIEYGLQIECRTADDL